MIRFWTVAVPHDPLPEPGDPVEVLRSDTNSGYVAWSRGRPMRVEAVVEYGPSDRRYVLPQEVHGTIGMISSLPDRLAVMRID